MRIEIGSGSLHSFWSGRMGFRAFRWEITFRWKMNVLSIGKFLSMDAGDSIVGIDFRQGFVGRHGWNLTFRRMSA